MSAQPRHARLGVHTSSFRELPLVAGRDTVDTVIRAMTECGARECELSSSSVEPAGFSSDGMEHHASMSTMTPQMMRRELRKWRLRTPASYFGAIGERLQKAGIRVYAYNYSPDSTFSDEEIDRGFAMARALGAEMLTTAAPLDVAKRIAPAAEKHGMAVGVGSGVELAASHMFKLRVDVVKLIASGVDPVAYLRDHHNDVASVYLTDCRGKEDGVLQLLKQEDWPIHTYVGKVDRGHGDVVEEVKRCFVYAQQALG